jgi:phosphoribosylformylglycinamidine synthase
MKPRTLILRAPGTNCNEETAFAFERAGSISETWHLNRLLETPHGLDDFQIICLPGGFSYGDDLAAGRIFGSQIRSRLFDALRKFKDDGKLILGICNGFQVLMKSGILLADLPAEQGGGAPATLTWNESGRYTDRWVNVGVEGNGCVFFQGIETMYLPIAHAEGKFVPRSHDVLQQLAAAGQLTLRYQRLDGQPSVGAEHALLPFPDNPNGAIANVAGVCDPTGRVCGLMPHPERHLDPLHHPRWTRGEAGEVGDGLQVFQNAVRYFG